MIGAIILAAGSSRRFGDDKRKARLPNGKMLIEETLDKVLTNFQQVILTLRSGDIEFQNLLEARYDSEALKIHLAPDSALGMGHSLASSMTLVDNWVGAFVFLADMPNIKKATINTLITALDQDNIVLPRHGDRRGHPVGFGQDFFEQLAALHGDTGARPVVGNNDSAVKEIDVNDPGVLQDIDRRSDLPASTS